MRSLRTSASAAAAVAYFPLGTRASPVLLRLVRSMPYHRICASVAVGFSVAAGCFMESCSRCQDRGSAIARCSTTSVMLQLSGVGRNFSWPSERPSSSLTSQLSLISRWATTRWRSPCVIGSPATRATATTANRKKTESVRMPLRSPESGRTVNQSVTGRPNPVTSRRQTRPLTGARFLWRLACG